MKYLLLALALSGCASAQTTPTDNLDLKAGYAAGICDALGDVFAFQKDHRPANVERFLNDYLVVFLNNENTTKAQLIKDCKEVRDYRHEKLIPTKQKRREWGA